MVTKAKEARKKFNMKGFKYDTRAAQLKRSPRKSPYDFAKVRRRRKLAKAMRRRNRGR